jgi:hypothetical protein
VWGEGGELDPIRDYAGTIDTIAAPHRRWRHSRGSAMAERPLAA